MVSPTLSELDTRRFGVRIARATGVAPGDVPRLLLDGRRERFEMVVVRAPADELAAAQAIEEAGGRLCDTLVYYARALGRGVPPPPEGVREASGSDAEAVAAVARAAFASYGGHYHADPRLDRAAADAAYADWAGRSCVDRAVAERVWVVDDAGGAVAGFLTLRVNSAEETEIVLNAVHPEHQRRGLYGRLVEQALAWSRLRGAARCVVSTQLSNVPVQKSWVRLGFEPSHAFHTFHLWLDGGAR